MAKLLAAACQPHQSQRKSCDDRRQDDPPAKATGDRLSAAGKQHRRYRRQEKDRRGYFGIQRKQDRQSRQESRQGRPDPQSPAAAGACRHQQLGRHKALCRGMQYRAGKTTWAAAEHGGRRYHAAHRVQDHGVGHRLGKSAVVPSVVDGKGRGRHRPGAAHQKENLSCCRVLCVKQNRDRTGDHAKHRNGRQAPQNALRPPAVIQCCIFHLQHLTLS